MAKIESNYEAKTPDANGLIPYTHEENKVWKTLYERQIQCIQGRACQEYIEGVKTLQLNAKHIPQCKEVSEILQEVTGWSVTPVAALISFEEFFNLLANKQFPAASFIRRLEELDYLKEPDIFHELFGHCPLLTNPSFANFTHEVGLFGQKASHPDRVMLARLYWFTVEFGLINSSEGLRIYGGGILSSFTETQYALESDIPCRRPFDMLTVLRTIYRYDELQKNYFIIDSFEQLYQFIQTDLNATFNQARALGMIKSNVQPPKDIRTC